MSLPHFELTELIKTIGYVGIFFMVFAESGLFFGFFFPGDSLLFTAEFATHPKTRRVTPNSCNNNKRNKYSDIKQVLRS